MFGSFILSLTTTMANSAHSVATYSKPSTVTCPLATVKEAQGRNKGAGACDSEAFMAMPEERRSYSWPYFDPEYETFSDRINPPRVSVENASCGNCTLIKVDAKRPGTLLDVMQVLSDLNLIITRACISSDGGWFMDTFHVTDQQGKKLSDRKAIEYIEAALAPKSNTTGSYNDCQYAPQKMVGKRSINGYTAIELIGTDRPGLLSEISAILSSLDCNVLGAEVWTHNKRIACILYVNDKDTSKALDNPARLAEMEIKLKNVLRGHNNDLRGVYTTFSVGITNVERRLHQLMFLHGDYEYNGEEVLKKDAALTKPLITIDNCQDKGYSVVNVQCKDRPKLLFDIVCALTDLQYVVFHASICRKVPLLLQDKYLSADMEYYIRRKDGLILDSKHEKEITIKCIEAAILRRVSEGLRLELCGMDRVSMLSDITRLLREHGLNITRASVTTAGRRAEMMLYVKNAYGNPVDTRILEALRQEIQPLATLNIIKVPNDNSTSHRAHAIKRWATTGYFVCSLLERLLSYRQGGC